ncbi:MAG: hypothetical protein HDQ87_03735 [Clostridia bacterium]|nr:hypothetical protein [Clostridia bacterium]
MKRGGFLSEYGSGDSFDAVLAEMDQVDQLDEDVQRLGRLSVMMKIATVLLLSVILLLGGRSPAVLDGAVIAGICALWTAEAFMLRRRRLEARLLRAVLKGEDPAPDLSTAALRERFPGVESRFAACFFSREVFGFYSPFLAVSLLASAFLHGQSQAK